LKAATDPEMANDRGAWFACFDLRRNWLGNPDCKRNQAF
jgi:hypothetical protein